MATSTLWSFALAAGCLLAALRLLQRGFARVAEPQRRRPILAYGLAFVGLVAVTTSLIGYARETRPDLDTCVASIDSGCTVADQAGRPVKGIEVKVLPVEKIGEARWYSKKAEMDRCQGPIQHQPD